LTLTFEKKHLISENNQMTLDSSILCIGGHGYHFLVLS